MDENTNYNKVFPTFREELITEVQGYAYRAGRNGTAEVSGTVLHALLAIIESQEKEIEYLSDVESQC